MGGKFPPLKALKKTLFILEEVQKGSLTPQSAAEAAKAALMLLGNALAQMAKERRKKVTKDLNKDLITLAEDPEMFEEAAPLLFGASFEKKMKDHLESLKCLRQSMAPRSGYRSDQFFFWGGGGGGGGAPPVSASGRRQRLQRKRRTEVPSLPPPKKWKRDSETVSEEGTASATETVESAETVYVCKALPVVHALTELKKFYPSVIVTQLIGLGIAPLATELARHSLPLAGRLQYFKSTWVKITQDPWVLEAIQGYRTPFSQQPYQPYPPRALTHSQAEEALMQQEIQSILEKHAIE